jgi:hypothetical protein
MNMRRERKMEVNEIIKRWKRLSRPRAVKEYCVECSGGTPQEVTICGLVDCPLWGFRFGGSPDSPSFKRRMSDAKERKPEEFKDAYAHLKE